MGMVLLEGPRGARFLRSETPLYGLGVRHLRIKRSLVLDDRGTSLIKNDPPPRATVGPYG